MRGGVRGGKNNKITVRCLRWDLFFSFLSDIKERGRERKEGGLFGNNTILFHFYLFIYLFIFFFQKSFFFYFF